GASLGAVLQPTFHFPHDIVIAPPGSLLGPKDPPRLDTWRFAVPKTGRGRRLGPCGLLDQHPQSGTVRSWTEPTPRHRISASPKASCGARQPRPIKSRVATSTTTG